jgi:putative PIN family toxin of toxin-antitoxin system
MSIPPRKKIVFDTNVLIRTTFRKRSTVSLRIYQALVEQECILVTSPAILEEIRDVISRDYIIAYTHTTPEMRRRFLSSLIDISMLTVGKAKLKKKSRDPKDNKFLVCASEAKADYLVTSDEDLLDMNAYEGTRIIPPHEFVELLERDKL